MDLEISFSSSEPSPRVGARKNKVFHLVCHVGSVRVLEWLVIALKWEPLNIGLGKRCGRVGEHDRSFETVFVILMNGLFLHTSYALHHHALKLLLVFLHLCVMMLLVLM